MRLQRSFSASVSLFVIALFTPGAMAQLEQPSDIASLVVPSEQRLACAKGDAEACLRTGHMVFESGIEGDKTEGTGWYVRACELGSGEGCLEAGYSYRDERGVDDDIPRMRAFMKRGCELDNLIACAEHSDNLWFSGRNEGDMAESVRVAKYACDNGEMLGCLTLADRYNVSLDEEERAQRPGLLKMACQRGELYEACYAYGLHLAVESGGKVGIGPATMYYEAACDGGVYEACSAAGMDYLQDEDTPENLAQGVRYLDLDCMKNRYSSVLGPCMKLHEMYAAGDRVEEDHAKAIEYIVKGCNKIEYGTCNALAELYVRVGQYGDAIHALEFACAHYSSSSCDQLYELSSDKNFSEAEREALNARMAAKCVGRLQPSYCEKLKGETEAEN